MGKKYFVMGYGEIKPQQLGKFRRREAILTKEDNGAWFVWSYPLGKWYQPDRMVMDAREWMEAAGL